MPNILLIEDHQMLRESLDHLMSAQGYSVSAFEAVEDVFERPLAFWDVAVLDVNLPGEDGLSFAARLRVARPDMIIIVLSVHAHTQNRVASYQCDADLFLPKPVDSAELLAALASNLRKKQRTTTQEPLTLDLQTHVLAYQHHYLRLTANESRLFHAMLLADGGLVEFWQLKAALGFMEDDGKNRLEVLISRLRKKVAVELGVDDLIQVERGQGYKLSQKIVAH